MSLGCLRQQQKNKYANKQTKQMLLDMKCIILTNINMKLFSCAFHFTK